MASPSVPTTASTSRERAELLRQLVDHVPSMLAYWDRDLRCRFANKSYKVWFGVDPDGLIGRPISELLGERLYALNEPFIRAVLRGEAQRFERVVPGADGVARSSVTYYTPDIVDGEVLGFVAYVTDVSPLKRAEEALNRVIGELKEEVQRRRSAEETALEVQRNLSVTLDSIGAGFIATDERGAVTRMNDAAERMTGWRADAARGESVWLVFEREGRPPELLTRNPIDVMQERGVSLNDRQTVRVVARGGARTTVELQATLTHDDAGRVRGLAMVFRDVTRLHAAELASRRLAALVESSNDAIIAQTLDGTITDWNAAAERLFGYPAREAIGQNMRMLVAPEGEQERDELLASIRAGVAVEPFEGIRVHRSGVKLDVSIRISPIRDADGVVIGASKIVRDISETKRINAELRRSNAELEQFAYVASHDLQEPLRMVVNYTELLAERYREQLDEKARKYIHYASDGARRMQRLVTDLLMYSRVGSQGKPLVPVSTEAVVHSVVRGLRALVDETGAEVVVGSLPPVCADETQLRQLLQNLISNALKFRSDAAPRVVIAAVPAGDRVSFSIADNGIGMEMRYAERIFQMFQRLHPIGRYPGSGIGLAVAKRIVERHGGAIWMESTLGVGSTFYFTLPAVPEA
jgi:PAS domain S-box-containing protein